MQTFIENNWLSILSIVIGIVVAYVFYRLQKKDAASASAERKKHATVELLDVVESYIINKQRLSEQVIENLIHASERDHSVALRPVCTAITLLQDVGLRLQRSRHLDIPQKSEYSEKIEQLIKEIREHREPIRLDELSAEISENLMDLESMLQPERRDEARKILTTIASLSEQKREESLRAEENRERVITLATTLLGAAAALATTLIGTKLFDTVPTTTISLFSEKVFPVVGITLAMIIAVEFIPMVLRIKRRTIKEASIDSKKTDG